MRAAAVSPTMLHHPTRPVEKRDWTCVKELWQTLRGTLEYRNNAESATIRPMKMISVIASAGWIIVAGCVSPPTEPPKQSSAAPRTAAPVATPHVPTDNLKEAAAKPSQPFEGEG